MKNKIQHSLFFLISVFVLTAITVPGSNVLAHQRRYHPQNRCGANPPSPVMSCGDIVDLDFTDLKFGEPIIITSASIVDAEGGLPQYCDVRGTISPEIDFNVKLPTTGNGKLYYVGGGGYNGTIPERNMPSGLLLGYATAGSNGGHIGSVGDGSFAYNNPDGSNPNWYQKIEDFGFRSVHETSNLAKKIIKAYYGRPPCKAYFIGCSNGGREGMQEAERYPDDFDGIVVGSPAISFTGAPFRGNWDSQASAGLLQGTEAIPAVKLAMLAEAVYDKCDGADGLEDGLINDPRLCTFDPLADLNACPEEEDYDDCFTLAQRTAIKKIYDGPKNSVGTGLYVGTPRGGAVLGNSGPASGWIGSIVSTTPGVPGDALSIDFFKYLAFLPQQDPDWNWETFNFDTDMVRIYTSGITDILDAASFDVNSAPNNAQLYGLRRFSSHGGKIIHYHGWADTLVSPLVSYKFYDSVLDALGSEKTKSFYKLYMVPGMFHCGGGVGCSNVDWFSALVDWVENGIEPEEIIGARSSNPELGLSARTRPMCPYPEVARYVNTGDIDDAANFACVMPLKARVRVKPETLTLGSDGKFEVSIMLYQRGYYSGDIDIATVTCGGAPAVEAKAIGGVLNASFNIKDLVGVLPGNKVQLKVYGTVADAIPFEGSDYVRINGWAWQSSYMPSSKDSCR